MAYNVYSSTISKIKNKIGFLREKIKSIKIKKEIEIIDHQEEKINLENLFLNKIDKYNSSDNNYFSDYKLFLNAPINVHPTDHEVLCKYINMSMDKLPKSILKDFLDWKYK